ncbi:MAG: hypothetical protein AAB426_05050 [Myxococcota bacterium]
MQTRIFGLWLLLAMAGVPTLAHAQYKNTSFGLDVGGLVLSQPTLVDANGALLSVEKRPIRLAGGWRLGGETSFKMTDDHWWFTTRVNLGLFQFSPSGNAKQIVAADPECDNNPSDATYTDKCYTAAYLLDAKDKLGTIIGVEGVMGVRYVVLTDRVRPYVQVALSYQRLMSFSSLAEQSCEDTLVCGYSETATYEAEMMPHRNVGALHLQPGLEFVFDRDIALHGFVDLQRWLVINAADNNVVVFGLGVTFFT